MDNAVQLDTSSVLLFPACVRQVASGMGNVPRTVRNTGIYVGNGARIRVYWSGPTGYC